MKVHLSNIGQTKLPRVKAGSPDFRNFVGLGAGIFLASGGILSILFSEDQRTLPQLGRIVRIILGSFMTIHFTLGILTPQEAMMAAFRFEGPRPSWKPVPLPAFSLK